MLEIRRNSVVNCRSFTLLHYHAVESKHKHSHPLLTHLWVVSNRHNDSDSHFDGLVSRYVHHAALLHPISASPCVWRTVQTLLANAAAVCGKKAVANDNALSFSDEYSRHYSSTKFILRLVVMHYREKLNLVWVEESCAVFWAAFSFFRKIRRKYVRVRSGHRYRRGSSIAKVTGFDLDGSYSIPVTSIGLCLLVHTDCGTHPAFCSVCTEDTFYRSEATASWRFLSNCLKILGYQELYLMPNARLHVAESCA
jgi:hypothetical protein